MTGVQTCALPISHGTGRSATRIELEAFRIDPEQTRPLWEEALEMIVGAWTQDVFEWRGPRFDFPPRRVIPKPLQQPHPPLWIGGWGDVTLRRAALLADAWLPGPTADLARLLQSQAKIQEHRRAAGLPEPAEWPVTRELCLAETQREARELADRHLMLAYGKEYGGTWKHPFIDTATAVDLDRLAADRFLIGTPDRVVRDLEPFEIGRAHV